ncbi:MAG: helix-turn-helix domain-containing protein [Clostridium sp.]|nr:helix-turn-helix domain-containing protein [Clostridium sp.]MCM1172344.1 helix-turn-helix domain-containing protein [Clostridium sp.]
MFKENLKMLRKQKRMSQEALACQLNVVRQTVSKWEKGLSVPDADMLIHIADLFDTSVSVLLGSDIEEEQNVNEIAVQLERLNNQLAHRTEVRKKIISAVIVFLFLCAIAAIYPKWNKMWYDFGRNLYHLFNH